MSLKQKLQTNTLTIGSWITLGHPAIAEIMAQSGFDWLTVDMEHSAITLTEAQQLIQVIELSGCVPLVRVGSNDPNLIKRVMDAGSHGVIVPMVNSAKDAEAAVKAVKYPPVGTRGVGLARAQGYGVDFENYKEWVEKESIVIVQIEHIDAVNNIEEILLTEGVDGFIIGPYDLSGSLGMPGDFNEPEVCEALEIVKKAAKKINIISGFHVVPPEPSQLKDKIGEGYRFLAYSLDSLFLAETCRSDLEKIRN
ncbi:aldolase/citrate lyase family protein [Methanolobus sp. ZRKC4]